jgi:sarcosine oxidase subunit gamma
MLFDQALDIPESLNSDGLKISLISERLRYSIRIKKSDLVAVKKIGGLGFPSKVGKTSLSSACDILCLGPDEWLVIAAPTEQTKLSKAFKKIKKDYVVSITEISHRNIGLSVMGPRAVRAINVGCSLDLSLQAFPIGKTTRTVFESASIVLTRRGEDAFSIECWRSFAPYLRDFFVRIVETND